MYFYVSAKPDWQAEAQPVRPCVRPFVNAQLETELNSTQLNCWVEFSSVFTCALNWRRPATIRRRNWRSSQFLHNRGTLSWICQSITGRNPATSCDDWRRRRRAGRRSSSPVQCTGENWTELNWTIQFSWVELSSVFRCALGFTKLVNVIILEPIKPTLTQIGTTSPRGNGTKRSTLAVRRSKFKVTRDRRL